MPSGDMEKEKGEKKINKLKKDTLKKIFYLYLNLYHLIII
jgi:hypothetical protein